jgi:hypothetical protein
MWVRRRGRGRRGVPLSWRSSRKEPTSRRSTCLRSACAASAPDWQHIGYLRDHAIAIHIVAAERGCANERVSAPIECRACTSPASLASLEDLGWKMASVRTKVGKLTKSLPRLTFPSVLDVTCARPQRRQRTLEIEQRNHARTQGVHRQLGHQLQPRRSAARHPQASAKHRELRRGEHARARAVQRAEALVEPLDVARRDWAAVPASPATLTVRGARRRLTGGAGLQLGDFLAGETAGAAAHASCGRGNRAHHNAPEAMASAVPHPASLKLTRLTAQLSTRETTPKPSRLTQKKA